MFELVYEILLMLGGIAMIVIGLAIKEQGKGSRVLNVVIGLAFFCYGFYLMFLAPVGTRYRIFFYAFILPILLIVRAVKARKEAKEAEQSAAVHHQVVPGQVYPAAPGQAVPQGQYPPQGGYGQAPQGQYPPQPSQPGQAPQGHPTA